MSYSIELIKNTLPYFQPYSILIVNTKTKETGILGDYKTIKKASEAKIYFENKLSYGPEMVIKHIKRKISSRIEPIEQLEKRIIDPEGDTHKCDKKELRRKIIID